MLTKFRHVVEVASQAEQLYVGAVIDRDLRSNTQVQDIEAQGAFVLSVHEVENLFLQPALLAALVEDHGMSFADAQGALRSIADRRAGHWVFQYVATREDWQEDLGAASGLARSLTLAELEADPIALTKEMCNRIPGLAELEIARRAQAIRHALAQWQEIRRDEEALWQRCFGKEALAELPAVFGLSNSDAYERRAARLWRSGAVPRPDEASRIKTYIDDLPRRSG